jgi:hypothetical protein
MPLVGACIYDRTTLTSGPHKNCPFWGEGKGVRIVSYAAGQVGTTGMVGPSVFGITRKCQRGNSKGGRVPVPHSLWENAHFLKLHKYV